MPSLIDILFSWTLKDIFNQHLYKDKVNKIPETFTSVEHYVNSFRNPLLEETRAELSSSMNNLTQSPTCEIKYLAQYKDSKPHELLYTLVVEKKVEDKEKKVEKNIVDKEVYVPQTWDVIAFSDVKSASVEDLNRLSYIPAVIEAVDDEGKSYVARIHASKPLEFDEGAQKKIQKLFAVFLVNTTTNCRIWRALNGRNLSIIEEVLDAAPLGGSDCPLCSQDAKCVLGKDLYEDLLSFNLNAPQREAMLNSVLSSACPHKSSVKLIWGPPGTGKTKTVATLLWTLLEMKCKTLTCAPTNTAVVEVTSRLMEIVKQKLKHPCYGLGDIVLLGNGERMKIDVHEDLHEVFLDYRCKHLAKCFYPFTGWSSQLQAMISLFEDPYKMYLDYLRSLEDKEKSGKCQQDQEDEVGISETNQTDEGVTEKGTLEKENVCQNKKLQYFEYFMKKFHEIRKAMKFCIYCMCTHMPTSQLSEKVVKDMDRTLIWLRAIKSMFSKSAVISEIVENLFKASIAKRQTIKVGIISPYKAQVGALNEKLGDKYGAHSDFSVIVRSVDGFQGGEEDVIIVSTVRSNASGLVGFLSNPQRTNVSLTRARYCLWIVGNALTLGKNKSVWKKLVTDARNRGCFFNADNDERLRGAIINSLVELDQIDLFNTSSLVFEWSRWKVIYSENFVSSWLRIKNVQTRKEIIAMLIKLSSGWRHHPQKPINLENRDGISSQLLEQYDIDGKLNVLWSVDIREEDSKCIQVLKFWDILPSTDMPKLAESLDHIFEGYTIDTLNRCKFKCLEGSLEVPKTWEIHQVAEQNYTSKTNSDLSTKVASLNLGSKPYIKDPRSRKEISQPKQFWQPKQRQQQVARNQ